MTRINSVQALNQLQERLGAMRDPDQKTIVLCAGSGCVGCGANDVVAAFRKNISEMGFSDKVTLRVTGCHGFCERGTLAVIKPEGIFYQQVQPKHVPDILEKTIDQGLIIKKLLYILHNYQIFKFFHGVNPNCNNPNCS